jgi:hypothetical protein
LGGHRRRRKAPGALLGKPRDKFVSVAELLAAVTA